MPHDGPVGKSYPESGTISKTVPAAERNIAHPAPPTNFDSSNLEWVESTDTRYIEYQKKVEDWKHQRNIELNPGRPLHPGW